jgi:porin
MKSLKLAIQAATLLALTAGVASAQTVQTQTAAAPNQPAPAPVSYAGGTLPTSAWSSNFVGPLAGIAKPLFNWGFRFDLTDSDQMLDNVSEGVPGHKGVFANTNKLKATVYIDLQKLIGDPDAQFRISETFHTLKEHGGTNNGFQTDSGSAALSIVHQNTTEPNTLSWLSYDQKFLNGQIDWEIGRMNPQLLMYTPNCDNIMTCTDDLLGYDASLPGPSFSTWTNKLIYNFTPTAYVQWILSEVDLHDQKTRGFHFGTDGDTGYINMAELAFKTNYKQTAYPYFWELGGWDENLGVPYKDPLTSQLVSSTTGVGIQGQNIIWREDNGATNSQSNRRLGTVVRLFATPDNSNIYQGQLEVGLNVYSLFPSRPNDVWGVKVTDFMLGGHENKALNIAQLKVTGDTIARNSQYLEINGHVQLTPQVAFEPVVMYAINPDSFITSKSPAPTGGFIVGAFVTINFGQMLGLAGL